MYVVPPDFSLGPSFSLNAAYSMWGNTVLADIDSQSDIQFPHMIGNINILKHYFSLIFFAL